MTKITIDICMGTTCFVLGASQLEHIQDQLDQRWPGLVTVNASRCLDLCKGGQFNGAPYVKINGVPVGKATPELIFNIIDEMVRT